MFCNILKVMSTEAFYQPVSLYAKVTGAHFNERGVDALEEEAPVALGHKESVAVKSFCDWMPFGVLRNAFPLRAQCSRRSQILHTHGAAGFTDPYF